MSEVQKFEERPTLGLARKAVLAGLSVVLLATMIAAASPAGAESAKQSASKVTIMATPELASAIDNSLPELGTVLALEEAQLLKILDDLVTKQGCDVERRAKSPVRLTVLDCTGGGAGPGSGGAVGESSGAVGDPLCEGRSSGPRVGRRVQADGPIVEVIIDLWKELAGDKIAPYLGGGIRGAVIAGVVLDFVLPEGADATDAGTTGEYTDEDGLTYNRVVNPEVATPGLTHEQHVARQKEVAQLKREHEARLSEVERQRRARLTDAEREAEDAADDDDNIDGEEEAGSPSTGSGSSTSGGTSPANGGTSNPGDIENISQDSVLNDLCQRRDEAQDRWDAVDVTNSGNGILPEFECQRWVTNPNAASDGVDGWCENDREQTSPEDARGTLTGGSEDCPQGNLEPCMGDDLPKPGLGQKVDPAIVPDLGPGFCDPRVCQGPAFGLL